ncbi:MAG: HDOD domain-containing protein [Deltaproteobacteria bacterium]|nr:HDOD domain-containing protein [Deltaproteobacteria bacterium]
MQKTTENFNASERRLQKACEYVSDLWFPVNPELLAKIKLGLHGGVYDLDPESLVRTVSGDFSLFMYCLRELLHTLQREGAKLPPLSNPVDILRAAGIERLRQLLDVDESRISRHSFDDIDEVQVARFQETMVSASSAEVLASSFRLEPEVGFSAALMRQLGHTLIAWNYPTVYKEALSSLDGESTLDVALAERLGFSPTLLAIRMLVSWGIPTQFCEALFLMDDEEEGDEDELAAFNQILAGSLAKLCRIGEALARANNPKLYPNAAHEWEFAKQAIVEKLGKDGLEMIQDALADNIEDYVTFMPEIFTGASILEPDLHLAQAQQDCIISRNPYLALCGPVLRAKLTAIYISHPQGYLYEKGLTELVHTVIPSSGFTAGCIYTIDPGVQMLLAQTKIGEMQLKKGAPIDYSIVASDTDSVSVAFRSMEPVVEFNLAPTGELISGIAGVIGHSNRIGVLYLEVPHSTFMQREKECIAEFKALARTVSDCLQLD